MTSRIKKAFHKLHGRYIFRSARTGRYVTAKFAAKHPTTTVREKVQ
jgi:hypothetical protein